jgi:hypothetical protein
MRVWLVSFVVLFGLAEMYQWAKQFTLPLPVYILGGAFLAIASNLDKRGLLPFQQTEDPTLAAIKNETPPVVSPVNSQSQPNPTTRSRQSVSFKIEKTARDAIKSSRQSTK